MNSNTVILEQIPVRFDAQEIGNELARRGVPDFPRTRLEEMIAQAAETVRPRAGFKLCGLTAEADDKVHMNGVTLTSTLVYEKLSPLGRAFPYLATEGRELAAWAAVFKADEHIAAGLIRETAVKQYEAHIERDITERYGIRQVSSLKPGSLALWPLPEQEHLFRLLAPLPEQLGVDLLRPRLLMDPLYSLAGIFFQTEIKFHNCQLCPQPNCPNRKAPSTVV